MQERKMLSALLIAITLVMGSFFSAVSAQEVDEPVQLRIATLGPGSAWYAYGATMAELLREALPSGSTVDVLPYAGSFGNNNLIENGEAELGLTMSTVADWAVNGTVNFDEPLTNVRTLVGGLDQYYYGIIVQEDFEYDSLEEIRENQAAVDIVTQPQGTLGQVGAGIVLEAAGISTDDIMSWGGSLTHTSTDVVRTEMQDGRADMWMQAIVPGHPTITELATVTGVRFLEFSPEVIAVLESEFGMPPATMPAGTFEGQDEDVALVGFPTVLVASAEMPDELAYLITKTIAEARDTLASRHAGMERFNPETAWTPEETGAPLHPGAERYYTEAGLMP